MIESEGPKNNLVFVVDENEKRAQGMFDHAYEHNSCVLLFLPHTQDYSTTMAQSIIITCRKIFNYCYLEKKK